MIQIENTSQPYIFFLFLPYMMTSKGIHSHRMLVMKFTMKRMKSLITRKNPLTTSKEGGKKKFVFTLNIQVRVGSWMTKKNVSCEIKGARHTTKDFFLIISFVLRHSNGEIRLINSRQENRNENSPSDILSCRPTRLRSGSYRTCHEGL